jgi:hypothetical protein
MRIAACSRKASKYSRFAFAAFVALLGTIGPAHAGPLVLEEAVRLTSPDPTYVLNGQVAAWGNGVADDFIVAAATKTVPGPVGASPTRVNAAFLFRRALGTRTWHFQRKLAEEADTTARGFPITVAANDAVIAINIPTASGSSLRVFQLEGEVSQHDFVRKSVSGRVETTDLEVSDAGAMIAAGTGSCSWDAKFYSQVERGQWQFAGTVTGPFRGCDDELFGGDVGVSGDNIVGHPANEDFPPQAVIYTNPYQPGSTIFPQATFYNPDLVGRPFGNSVAMWGWTTLASGSISSGTSVFDIIATGWRFNQQLRPVDMFAAGVPAYIEMKENLILQQHNQPNGAVAVFQEQLEVSGSQLIRRYPYVAKLVPSVGAFSYDSADLGHRIAVVQGQNAAYVYDLPTSFEQPPLRHDDFQDGNAFGWNPQTGGSFSVVNGSGSRVYRQQSLAGNATSLLSDSVMRNQSIQADVKPIAFQGTDRWLGLAVRYVDASNYYYVALRSSNVLQLRRIVNGSFSTLASMPLTVTPGRTYNVRLEAIGGTLRVYINGRQVLRARDETHEQGSAGLIMYRTSADYDNVIVSPNPRTVLLSDNFEGTEASWWIPRGIGNWTVETDGQTQVYAQTMMTDGTHTVTGVETTEDQIIETRAKATAFGTGVGRWFGVMARYISPGNYYYVTLRNDNTISLRKLVRDTIHVLDSSPLTVTTGTWYTIRLEAIGNELRTYINGRLVLEAHDDTFAQGSYGLVNYKAAARYDDFRAVEP